MNLFSNNNPSVQIPLVLHLATEIPASLSFLLAPRAQLPSASRDATLILRNFGGSLLSTNLLCLGFLFWSGSRSRSRSRSSSSATIGKDHDHGHGHDGRDDGHEDDVLAGLILLSLASYHFWPIWRAWDRMSRSLSSADSKGKDVDVKSNKVLGGPKVHFVVHVVCLVVLVVGGVMNL
ncbi:hypothetical protein QBC42DRAFT_296588 [Cladorrhinum samala]|uniref:Uncharacterized protein n=1 Tax=Cladorrhinum samala TaxID=585594 RepID=A0AAV9HPD8_9PEZI|nr:hypothetical protein QBC42DRAFT_296588 [Cladorrhinum samala]